MEDFCLQGCFSVLFAKTKLTPRTQDKRTYITELLSWIKDARSPNLHPNEQCRKGVGRSEGNLKLQWRGDRVLLTAESSNNPTCQKSAKYHKNSGVFCQSVPCSSPASLLQPALGHLAQRRRLSLPAQTLPAPISLQRRISGQRKGQGWFFQLRHNLSTSDAFPQSHHLKLP